MVTIEGMEVLVLHVVCNSSLCVVVVFRGVELVKPVCTASEVCCNDNKGDA